MAQFADVILPLPLSGSYTYALPDEWAAQVCEGCRLVVPFGPKRFYTALVRHVHTSCPEGYEVKEAALLLDSHPTLLPLQLQLWDWMADYYLCTLGEVYKAALPTGLKPESETLVTLQPDYEAEAPLPEREMRLLDLLGQKDGQSVAALQKASGYANTLVLIERLLQKGAISIKESLRQTYRPKTELHIRLAEAFRTEAALHTLLDRLEQKAPKQADVVMKYLSLSGSLQQTVPDEVSKSCLLQEQGCSPAALTALLKNGILESYTYEIGRLAGEGADEGQPLHPLNPHQEQAFLEIESQFRQKSVCLLYGVTSSGKTEIYIHLIAEALRRGEQVLYLLPEIALTDQILRRLRRVFGTRLGVYHSKYPDAERVEVWQRQLSDHPYDIILGVRSSIFLPFQRLGLVIVDEEHETSYKQQDPAPRYHARNAALVLAAMAGAKTLLGSATPSIESWHHATTGKYGLVRLMHRHQELQLPEIVPVDIQELQRKRRMNGPFSPLLLQRIHEALDRKEQVILFQNRRGFAPMIECHTCGWVPKCKYCDVSLTYHKGNGQMTCHYCGYTVPVPRRCPACEGTDLRNRGFGTEKIEDEMQQLFPEARVARMDLDTTRTRTAYERIIADFEQGKTDVLIGTQMVSKGLDFDRVSVVGILHADTMLNYPDFRAYERAFQLMAQVAGRAGRKQKQGLVLLQTKSMAHPIIRQVMTNDFEGMVATQLEERRLFRYPPFYRLVYIYLKHRDEALLDRLAHLYAERLRAVFGARVLGPDRPPVSRVQTLFIRKLMLKVEVEASMSRVRECLRQLRQQALSEEAFKSILLYYDVDPM